MYDESNYDDMNKQVKILKNDEGFIDQQFQHLVKHDSRTLWSMDPDLDLRRSSPSSHLITNFQGSNTQSDSSRCQQARVESSFPEFFTKLRSFLSSSTDSRLTKLQLFIARFDIYRNESRKARISYFLESHVRIIFCS